MNAGAPVKYRTSDDDPSEEPEGLLGCIGWDLAGAWAVYKDYAWANILEAYYAMTEAHIAARTTMPSTIALPVLGKPLLLFLPSMLAGNLLCMTRVLSLFFPNRSSCGLGTSLWLPAAIPILW